MRSGGRRTYTHWSGEKDTRKFITPLASRKRLSGKLTSSSLTSDQIEHAYLFFRDDIEICLRRLLHPVPLGQKDPATPSNPLPPWDSIANVDELDQWMLEVKLHVLQDNKPDEVRKAQEELVAMKTELEGVFQFEVIERQFLDTRVPLEVQATPAPLPQVVRAGD